MKVEINLFSSKVKAIRRKQKLKQVVFESLFIVALVLAGALIGLSSYSLWLAKTNKVLDLKIQASKDKIESLREVETKQVYLTGKLESFEGLLGTHERHQAVTETVFDLLPDGTSLKGFEVEESGEVKLSGAVASFSVLEDLLDRVRNSSAYRLSIIKAEMNKISYSQEGTINFDLLVTLGVKG